jgi:branched-chain amino acid transport system permease protein
MRTLYAYPLFVAGIAAIAALNSAYLTNLAIISLLHALPAIGLALLLGYTGQISLGHAAFFGLGAYLSGILSHRTGLSPWMTTALAAAVVGVIGWQLGWIIFRLKGHHLAIATLGFGIIAYVAFVEARAFTGGPVGLSGIPPLTVLGQPLTSDAAFLPVAALACLAAVAMALNLVRAPYGYLMRGVAQDERAAESVGIDVARIKRNILVLSAVLSSIGGSLYAHYIGFISPAPFNVSFSVKLLLMVAIGGFSGIWSILFGVIFITVIAEPLQELGYLDVVVYGVLLVLISIKFPQGLLQGLFQLAKTTSRRFLPSNRKAAA